MQSISVWVHFLSLAFLEALSVTNVALLYRMGSCCLYSWGRSTWFLKWCHSDCCQHDEGGQGGNVEGMWGSSPQISGSSWERKLLSSDKKPTGLWKMPSSYPYLWKQGPFPIRWYQHKAQMCLSLKGKIYPLPHSCRCAPLGIWLLQHASKKKQAPIVCHLFNPEISTLFWFSVVQCNLQRLCCSQESTWTWSYCRYFSTAKPHIVLCNA